MDENLINGRYKIVQDLARGGTGVVYLVEDVWLSNKRMVLKMLDREVLVETLRQHFIHEFRFLRKLCHTNLVEVFDFGILEEKNQVYFTAEYVPGEDIVTATRGLNFSEIYPIIVQVCRALEYVHSRGVLHADIKPTNILVTKSGSVKILDFGLAREASTLANPHSISGTLEYIAPEVLLGEHSDHRSDLYSFGVLLYQILTRALPFEHTDPRRLVEMHIRAVPRRLRDLNASIPVELENIILGLLAKDPAERFGSANEVITALNNKLGTDFELETRDTERSYIFSGRLVGRRWELERLKEVFSEFKAKRGSRFIMISGESGVGKTRLKTEFKAFCQIHGMPIYTATYYENVGAALQPFLDMLKLLATSSQLWPEADDFLKRYPYDLERVIQDIHASAHVEPRPRASVSWAKEGLLAKLSEYLIELSKRRPLIIYLDDLHWADEVSVDLFQYILNDMYEGQLIICGDYRMDAAIPPFLERFLRDNVHEGKIEELKLNPLDEKDTEELIVSMFGKIFLPEELLSLIHKETSGNPFYIAEVIKTLVDERVITKEKGFWGVRAQDRTSLNIPSMVSKAFAQRFQRLDEKHRRALGILALFNKPVKVELLQSVSELNVDLLTDILVELEKRQVLMVSGESGALEYYFRHIKMRSIIYEGLNEHFKAHMHERIGKAVEAAYEDRIGEAVEDLAYHFSRSGDRQKAKYYLLAAAEKLEKYFSIDRALECYREGLALLGEREVERRFAVLENIADLYRLKGNVELAHDILSDLLEESQAASDPEVQARLYLKLAKLYDDRSEFNKVIDLCQQGLKLLARSSNVQLKGGLFGKLGFGYFRLGQYDKAIQYSLQGLNECESAGEGLGMTEIYTTLFGCYYYQGNREAAIDCCSKALRIYENMGHLVGVAGCYTNMGIIFSDRGDYDRAIEYATRSLKIREKINDKRGLVFSYISLSRSHCNLGRHCLSIELLEKALKILYVKGKYLESEIYRDLGRNYYHNGQYARALECAQKSLSLAEETGSPQVKLADLNMLAKIYLSLGAWDRVKPLLDDALGLCDTLESKLGRAETLQALARYHHARAELPEAERSFKQSVAIFETMGSAYFLCEALLDLADFYYDTGRIEESLNCLNQTLPTAKSKNYLPLLARCQLLEGKVRQAYLLDHTGAFDSLASSLKTAEGTERPELRAQIHYHLGVCCAALKNYDAAERHYKEAVATLTRLLNEIPEGLREPYLGNKSRSMIFHGAGEFRRVAMAVRVGRGDGRLTDAHEAPSSDTYFLTLFQISRVINSILDLDDLLEKIMDLILESVKAERGVILLLDEETADLGVKAARNISKETLSDPSKISMSIVDDVLKSVRPIISTDAIADPRLREKKSVVDYRIKTVLCAPIKLREKIIGVIYLDNHLSRDAFTERDLNFLDSLTNLFAVSIENARLHEALKRENIHLRQEVKEKYHYENLVGTSRQMQELFRRMDSVIKNSVNVLIQGESGTGKELVARAIHYNSDRKDKRFVTVDCGALPDDLIESELFGHKKGSFTGALLDKEGLFETANGGTIFLDEISNTSASLQAKLLRVIQEKEVRRLGETTSRKVDVRIISASNRDLSGMVERGEFRRDLYYRLKVIQLSLPPLRERKEDIPLLIRHFLKKLNERNATDKIISSDVLQFLQGYPFPGNVRELENIIEASFYLARGEKIDPDALPEELKAKKAAAPISAATARAHSAPAPERSGSSTEVWPPAALADAQALSLFERLVENKESFWTVVKAPFMERAISVGQVREVVRLGLQQTKGRYKDLAGLFNLREDEYKPFMNFLRKNNCHVDYREFRA